MIVEVIWLLFLSPIVLRALEKLYSPPKPLSLEGENSMMIDDAELKASIAARSDVNMVSISYLFEAISMLCMGLSRTGTQMIISASILGCYVSSTAAVRSAAAASVPPLQSGEVLAALELVNSLSQLLSPLQGVLMTLLINTAPEVVLFIAALISFIASVLPWFVRDEDRYKSHSDNM